MEFSEFLPIWDKLTPAQQQRLQSSALRRKAVKDTVLHSGSADCLGLLFLISGQLRGYMLSSEGREVTLYRLFERDVCLFSASCMLHSAQFDIFISAEKDTEFWMVPPNVFLDLMQESAAVANFINEIMASRFSEVMWMVEQIMWKSFDKRLASFLLEECVLEGTNALVITHEKIANHMGTAREVVTRMLRYFQSEELVVLRRGIVEVKDEKRLRALSRD